MGKETKGEGKMTQLTSQLMSVAPCPVNSPVVTGSLSAIQQNNKEKMQMCYSTSSLANSSSFL